jgi:hypothetical protein
MICQCTVSFPLTFPCNNHFACHACVHALINQKKYIRSSIQEISMCYPFACPVCAIEIETTELLDHIQRTQVGVMDSLTSLLQSLRNNGDIKSTQHIPLVDDVKCPYCRGKFKNKPLHERYNHLKMCSKRVWTCSCNQPYTQFSAHRGNCTGFHCHLCHEPNLSALELDQHFQAPIWFKRNRARFEENLNKLANIPEFVHNSKIDAFWSLLSVSIPLLIQRDRRRLNGAFDLIAEFNTRIAEYVAESEGSEDTDEDLSVQANASGDRYVDLV